MKNNQLIDNKIKLGVPNDCDNYELILPKEKGEPGQI
jgi:hypothetical protein